ncbi:MAG: type IV pilus assembly protein PilM [Fimbriimonadaceae bacterium]|nr:type IV pilus assembly protein PilM [Fimbriimonadaceae bacterium]
MAKKLSSVVGIDIGSRSIKVAEIRNAGKEASVTGLGMIDTPEGAVDHTGIYNAEAVAGALKQVLSASGISNPNAVVSIAGQASVLVRTLEVPRMNPAELKEHMQWEINRNIPFSESTVVSDFKPLADEDPTSQNMEVVMAISPQSAIDTVMACLKKAGRNTAAIDVEPLGLARSLVTSYDDQHVGKTVCLVEIGHKTTSINIYRNGKLLLPRQVPMGGEMFTQAIADAMGVSNEEAERLKQETADLDRVDVAAGVGGVATQAFTPYNPFADETPADDAGSAPTAAEAPAEIAPVADAGNDGVNKALAGVAEEFAAEIKRSLDYYRSRGSNVDVIALCGGGAKLRGLGTYLTKSTGQTCDNYDPMRRLNLNIRKVPPAYVDEHREEFAVAVGNGLHICFE